MQGRGRPLHGRDADEGHVEAENAACRGRTEHGALEGGARRGSDAPGVEAENVVPGGGSARYPGYGAGGGLGCMRAGIRSPGEKKVKYEDVHI